MKVKINHEHIDGTFDEVAERVREELRRIEAEESGMMVKITAVQRAHVELEDLKTGERYDLAFRGDDEGGNLYLAAYHEDGSLGPHRQLCAAKWGYGPHWSGPAATYRGKRGVPLTILSALRGAGILYDVAQSVPLARV